MPLRGIRFRMTRIEFNRCQCQACKATVKGFQSLVSQIREVTFFYLLSLCSLGRMSPHDRPLNADRD